MFSSLPTSWQRVLSPELERPYWSELSTFIRSEYGQYNCFPQEDNIFRAFEVTSFDQVRVVILGQDPYHTS